MLQQLPQIQVSPDKKDWIFNWPLNMEKTVFLYTYIISCVTSWAHFSWKANVTLKHQKQKKKIIYRKLLFVRKTFKTDLFTGRQIAKAILIFESYMKIEFVRKRTLLNLT